MHNDTAVLAHMPFWCRAVSRRPRLFTQDAGRALGATIAALGLSNKAVYEDDDDDDAGPGEVVGADHQYPDGPDIAPGSAPSSVAGNRKYGCGQALRPCAWTLSLIEVLFHALLQGGSQAVQ